MSYENEQRRFETLLQQALQDEDQSQTLSDSEVESDGEQETLEPDQIQYSESEEDLSDRESSDNNSFFLGKDKRTEWNKKTPRQFVHTRSFNIITRLPGHRRAISGERDPLQIWRHFFNDTIIDVYVKYTNQYIETVKHKNMPETNPFEIKYLIGLILLAGVQKSNHLNIEELFRTDGGSVEIFRLSMSNQRFQFLLRVLRFDDSTTR